MDAAKKALAERSSKALENAENVEAIRRLRKWLNDADETTGDRFDAQLAIAETLAARIDAGEATVAGQYRQIVDKIHERIDRIFGTKNLDVISRMQQLIDDNAKKRVEEGWNA